MDARHSPADIHWLWLAWLGFLLVDRLGAGIYQAVCQTALANSRAMPTNPRDRPRARPSRAHDHFRPQ